MPIAPPTVKFEKSAKQREALRAFATHLHTLTEGGSRSGKSFINLYAVIKRAARAPYSRHLILRLRFNHAKTSIWHDTLPKMLALACPKLKVHWNNSDYFLQLPNGAQIWLGGLDDPQRSEKIFGTEYATIDFEEANQMEYESIQNALTRLAQKVYDEEGKPLKLRAYYNCNPVLKRHWLYLMFHLKLDPVSRLPLTKPNAYAHIGMNPSDNRENINEEYFSILEGMTARKRKRFLEGLWLDEVEGALWNTEMLDATRIRIEEQPIYHRIVVGVDPSGRKKQSADEQGIVAAGAAFIGGEEHFYLLMDRSGHYSPQGWGTKTVDLYDELQADRVVGESNYGGDMVQSTIKNIDPNVSYKDVHASRSKLVRAEPVAALGEQGRLHIVGTLPELEDEMVSTIFAPGESSPNRLDAAIWAVTDLMGKKVRSGPNVRSL